MRGVATFFLIVSLLPVFVGCAGGSQPVEAAVQQDPPTATQSPPVASHAGEAKHPLVRALLDALQGVEAEEADVRTVRQSLLEADAELVRVSGANLREAILRANQKPPVLMVHPDYQEPVPNATLDDAVPEASKAGAESPPADVPVDAVPDGARTPPQAPAAEPDPFGTP